MIRALALLPVLLAASGCGGGGSSAPTTAASTQAPAAKKALHVVVSAESHHPRLGHTWTYEVHVTDAATGKPVAARIRLQFTFGGNPVATIGRHVVKDGVWKETIPATGKDAFPPAALGQKIALRATATAAGYRTASRSWKVQVVK